VSAIRRHGKYLLIDLDRGLTLLSHLGMSGHWLFYSEEPGTPLPHVHVRIGFTDGGWLWFQDPRRFGLLRGVPTEQAFSDPSLALLGPDPLSCPLSPSFLRKLARGTRLSVKNFLLDQRRLAGIGNIYASEILHRAAVDPRRSAGALDPRAWKAIAAEIPMVLEEAIARMGTTFSSYRTLWNEPGAYGEKLLVYDRADQPCRRCGATIRRILQSQRSTFFCPHCQGRRGRPRPKQGPSEPGSRPSAR
jgi:formamidopyrimidine-DNA glycosylase